jgi:UDP:flavonoid glycosyltransferase YjiC (YdhE family)
MTSTDFLQGKKILFANVPGDGHFNPLTGLAKHLQELGCDVRWYASGYYKKKLEKLSIPHYLFTKALDVPSEKIDEVFPERKHIKGQIKKLNFDMINYFILRSTDYLQDIKDIYVHWPADALVADCLFSSIPFIRSELKIPVISIGVLPLIQTSKDLGPSGLGLEPSYHFFGKIKQELLKKMANKVLFKKPNRLFFSLMDKLHVPHTESNVFDVLINSATLFLQSGTPGMEYYRSDLGSNIRYIGPVLPYAEKNKNREKWWDARLDQYKKIILVTQGTVEKDAEKLLVPTLEAFKESDTLVIATTGGSGTTALQQRYPHKNIIIEDFISFDDVMPYAQVFVTNGGFGGVLQSVQYGLPMVTAGVHEGKNEICSRIGYFKYGINLKTEKPTAIRIKNAVNEILQHNTCKTNIARLSKEFETYPVNDLFAGYVQEALCMPV